MNKVKKIALLFTLVIGISVLSYSYEDYYEKIYNVKMSKSDLFNAIHDHKNQQIIAKLRLQS